MRPTIVIYGDSIGQNMATASVAPVVDRSDSGAGFHAPVRLQPVESIPRGHPVIFSVGWNDTHVTHLPSYQKEVAARLLEIARQAEGQPIVLLLLEPLAHQQYWQVPKERVETANATLHAALADAQAEAKRQGIPMHAAIVDPNKPTPIGNREPEDGLHYTPTGARLLFERARGKIESMAGRRAERDAPITLASVDRAELLSPSETPVDKTRLSTVRNI